MIKDLNKWLEENKMQEIKINMGMFYYSVNVLIGNIKHVEEYSKHIEPKNDYDYPDAQGYCLDGDNGVIIWIPKFPKTPIEYAVLCHECVHAAVRMLDTVDVPITKETDEVLAYTVDYLVSEILEKQKSPQLRSKPRKKPKTS